MEHDYFGIIEEDPHGGLHWSDSVEVGDQHVEVELSAPDRAAASGRSLDAAVAVIHAIDGFDARARDALVAQLDERASVTAQYVEQSVDALGESLLDLLVDNSGDLEVDVLKSLQLVRLSLHPGEDGDGDPFAVLTYALDPDEPESPIRVTFDIRGDVVQVETEQPAADG